MENHLDPGYLGHAGSSLVTGVTALRLANADILPFHYSDYAAAVASYVEDLQQVQAETPGAAQLDLAILLEAAHGWGDAVDAARGGARTSCSRRRPRRPRRRRARSRASTAR